MEAKQSIVKVSANKPWGFSELFVKRVLHGSDLASVFQEMFVVKHYIITPPTRIKDKRPELNISRHRLSTGETRLQQQETIAHWLDYHTVVI